MIRRTGWSSGPAVALPPQWAGQSEGAASISAVSAAPQAQSLIVYAQDASLTPPRRLCGAPHQSEARYTLGDTVPVHP